MLDGVPRISTSLLTVCVAVLELSNMNHPRLE
jgi:hypothetical protein